MDLPIGLYPRFLVKRKAQLIPLMEKHTAQKIPANIAPGKLAQVYLALLKSDPEFKKEVEVLILSQIKDLATKEELAIIKKLFGPGDIPAFEGPGDMPVSAVNRYGSVTSVSTPGTYHNAADPITAIAGAVGGIFGTIKASKEGENQSDAAFYEAVLTEQKKDDTTKILIVTGLTLAFVAIGVYFVLKLKKK